MRRLKAGSYFGERALLRQDVRTANVIAAGEVECLSLDSQDFLKFIGDLDAGFRLLNLKNDNLRKRFDGLKYDLKKCEEVVYDITLRGLVPRQQQLQLSPVKAGVESGENVEAGE